MRLVGLGIDGAVKYQPSHYEGLLQKDLINALKVSTDCKERIWNDLKDKLIVSKKIETNAYQEKYHYRPEETQNPLTIRVKNELDKAIDKALTHYEMGIRSYNDGNFHVSVSHFDDALEIIVIPSFLLAKGNSFLSLSDYTKAENLYNDALSKFRKISDLKGEAITLQHLGMIQKDKGEFDTSLRTLEMALTLMEENNFEEEKASCLNIIGLIYKDQDKFTDANKKFSEAYEISDKNKFLKVQADSLANIGLLKIDSGDLKGALTSLEESLAIYQKKSNRQGEAFSRGSIGLIYNKMNSFNKAEYNFNKALEIFNEIEYQLGIADSMGNIGIIYMNKNEYDAALRKMVDALKIFRKIGYSMGEAKTLQNIGLVYNKIGEYGEALQNLEKAKKIFEAINANAQLLSIKEVIYNIENTVKKQS